MTKLYLARHGETEDNAAQIMQGQTQGRLNERGRQQALELSERMADEPIDAVIASDLHRAIETADILAAPHHLAVATTPLLRERDWGSFTGRYIPDLKDEVWPDDIETLDDLKARAAAFLDFVRTHYADQTVLAVGHGIINKAIQAVYHNITMREVPRMGNAEVRELLVK